MRLAKRTALRAVLGVGILTMGGTCSAFDDTWTGNDGDGLYSNPFNWENFLIPGSPSNSGTNTTSTDVATFHAAASTTIDVQADEYRRLGQIRTTGPGDVRLFGLQPTGTYEHPGGGGAISRAFNINSEDELDSFRVEAGNLLLEADNKSATTFEVGRYNSDWFVEAGSTLTFDLSLNVINTGTAITKTGGGTVVFKHPNSGGGGTTAVNWTIAEGTIRSEADVDWKGNTGAAVLIMDGATMEMVNSSYGSNNVAVGNPAGGLILNGNGDGGVGAIYASGGGISLIPSGSNTNPALNPAGMVLESDSSIGVETESTLIVYDDITDRLNPLNSSAGPTAGLTKVGGGTLILESASGYHDETVVSEGTLLINTSRGQVKNVTSSTFNETTGLTRIVLAGGENGTTAGLSVGQTVHGGVVRSFNTYFSTSTNVFVEGNVVDQVGGGGAGTATFDELDNGLYYFDDVESAKLVTVQSGATLGGTGAVRNTHVDVEAGGTLAPGSGVGTFDVGSADVLGTLLIEYDGDNSMVDQLNVLGALDISGAALEFQNLGLADLTGGNFVLASYGELLGDEFLSVTGLPTGFSLDYDFAGNQIAIIGSAPPLLEGDFNGDGTVDAADYTVWRNNLGGDESVLLGAGDGSDIVDAGDYTLWKQHFGMSQGAASLMVSSQVPEPTSLVLACMVGAGCLVWRGFRSFAPNGARRNDN